MRKQLTPAVSGMSLFSNPRDLETRSLTIESMQIYHNFIVLSDLRSKIGEIPDFYQDFQLSERRRSRAACRRLFRRLH